MGGVPSRARRQAVVAQTIASPCFVGGTASSPAGKYAAAVSCPCSKAWTILERHVVVGDALVEGGICGWRGRRGLAGSGGRAAGVTRHGHMLLVCTAVHTSSMCPCRVTPAARPPLPASPRRPRHPQIPPSTKASPTTTCRSKIAYALEHGQETAAAYLPAGEEAVPPTKHG